jgi:outer membrane protein OmpA-like peptidoglycan-associated protein
MKKILAGVLAFGLILSGVGCITVDNPEEGALVGAAGGAIVGSLIGDSAGDVILGAIIGAAIGGAAGAYVGRYMDRQAAEIRDNVGDAEVDRVGEGIRIYFNFGLFFDAGGFELLVGGRERLDRLALVLNRYPDTYICVDGQPYVAGTYEPDVVLSQRRARAVSDYMARRSVRANRLRVLSRDQVQPGARGGGSAGRPQAARMGLAVMANDQLKSTARQQVR